jgi:hypothetical protein
MDPWQFTATNFKQRRRDTWRAMRLWLAVAALSIIGLKVATWRGSANSPALAAIFESSRHQASLNDMEFWQLNLSFASFVALGVSVVAIVLAVRRHYRCPKCNAVPMGSWTTFGSGGVSWNRGVDLNPTACPKCGAKLR